jgi:hypothetical protein
MLLNVHKGSIPEKAPQGLPLDAAQGGKAAVSPYGGVNAFCPQNGGPLRLLNTLRPIASTGPAGASLGRGVSGTSGGFPLRGSERLLRSSRPGQTPIMKVMRAFKYVIPLWIGIIIYSVAVMTIGKTGFRSYDDLSYERDKQRLNLEKLHDIQEKL